MDSYSIVEKTRAEYLQEYQDALLSVDASLSFDSNTPMGNLVQQITQLLIDFQDTQLVIQSYRNPNQAQGKALDDVLSMNAITRKSGTFTQQPIEITITGNVNLQGLDENSSEVENISGFTVADGSSNEYLLLNSESFTSGVYTRTFRARVIGGIVSPTNTINTISTPEIGVNAVNNSSQPTSIGEIGELDSVLRVKRELLIYKNGSGAVENLYSQLLQLDNVNSVIVRNNITNATVDGVPSGYLYVVIDGGSDEEIAKTIAKNNSIARMLGDTTYEYITPRGTSYLAKFDRPQSVNIYLQFDLKKYTTFTPDLTAIKNSIESNFIATVGRKIDTGDLTPIITSAINSNIQIGQSASAINIEVSLDGISWADFLIPANLKDIFSLSTANITIVEV